MAINTNTERDRGKLGSFSAPSTFVTPIPKPKRPKIRARKGEGWIRWKKINGRRYFYACWLEDGKEKNLYLGKFNDIVNKVLPSQNPGKFATMSRKRGRGRKVERLPAP